MKRAVRVAFHFYPAAWRRRYGVEFDAMLDQLDSGWKDVFDIFKGAMTMRLNSWSFRSILTGFATAGVLMAAALAFSIPARYRSTSVLYVNTVAGPTPKYYVGQAWQDLSGDAFLQGVARRNGILQGRPSAEVVQSMRNHISVRSMRAAESRHHLVLAIDATESDPKAAQGINRDLLAELTSALPRAGAVTSLEVLDPSSSPMRTSPGRAVIVLIGLFAGLLTGLAVAYALRRRIAIIRGSAF